MSNRNQNYCQFSARWIWSLKFGPYCMVHALYPETKPSMSKPRGRKEGA